MTEVVKHWVAVRKLNGNPVVFGPFETEDQAVSMWVDLLALDIGTARVVCAKDETEAKEWL